MERGWCLDSCNVLRWAGAEHSIPSTAGPREVTPDGPGSCCPAPPQSTSVLCLAFLFPFSFLFPFPMPGAAVPPPVPCPLQVPAFILSPKSPRAAAGLQSRVYELGKSPECSQGCDGMDPCIHGQNWNEGSVLQPQPSLGTPKPPKPQLLSHTSAPTPLSARRTAAAGTN